MDEPLVPLWSQFRSYLKVRLEVHHAGGVSKNAVLEVIVENSAPSSESFPNVTFESVEAVVNIGLHAETVAVGRLGPGEAHQQTFTVALSDVAICNASVAGQISLAAFSEVQSTTQAASGQVGLSAYLQVFDWLDLVALAERLHAPFPVGPTTTLGEIEAKKNELRDAAKEVTRRGERLKAILQMIKPEGDRQKAIPHHNAVARYVRDVSSAFGQLEQSLGSQGSPRGHADSFESQATQLIAQADALRG